jgi:hypothetical protein
VYLGNKKSKKWLVGLGLALPILVAGLRYMVGIDYENYIDIIDALAGIDISTYVSSYMNIFEPTLFIFAKTSHIFGDNFILFFVIYSALTIVPFYIGMKKLTKGKEWLAILLFLLVFFSPSLNAVRQYAAISLAFLGTVIYLQRATVAYRTKFLTLLLAAILIHSSAICTLLIVPMVWVAKILSKKNLLQNVFYCSIATIAIFLAAKFAIDNLSSIPILNKYAYSLGFVFEEGSPTPNLIAKLTPILIASVFLVRLRSKYKNATFYFIATFMTLAMSLLGFVVPFGYRLADYFGIFQIPLLLSVIGLANTNEKQRIFVLLAILYGVVYFLYSAFLNDSHGIFPYSFVL